MNLIDFYARRSKMVAKGWEYRFNRWKTYKADKLKREIKVQTIKDRIAHNDKVCRMYGIGKYSRKDYY
jgi:hypothetical protein